MRNGGGIEACAAYRTKSPQRARRARGPHAIIRARRVRGSPTRAQERAILFSILQAAGWPIWPLLICSIAALAVIIERFTSLRVLRVAPPRLLDEVISVTRAHLPAPDVVNKLADNS